MNWFFQQVDLEISMLVVLILVKDLWFGGKKKEKPAEQPKEQPKKALPHLNIKLVKNLK